jgi:hypothetical protein
MTHLLTLYARREPSTSRPHMHVGIGAVPSDKRNVALYKDPVCQEPCGVYA